MNTYFTKIVTLVRMGAKMKTIIITFILCLAIFTKLPIKCISQTGDYNFIDSVYVSPFTQIVTKGNQILTFARKQNSLSPLNPDLILFDGYKWRNLSQDTMPTLYQDSKLVISDYSPSIYATGQYHLWEYDGKDWIKHAIYDSLYHQRRFLGLVELSDSSLILTALTKFITYSNGTNTYIDRAYSELLRFKNGQFTVLASYMSHQDDRTFFWDYFEKAQLDPNGNLCILTPLESESKQEYEFVTYNNNLEVLHKFKTIRNEDLPTKYPQFVEVNDYTYDKNGSLWVLTSTQQDSSFCGIMEFTKSGEIRSYKQQEGVKFSDFRSYSIEVDEDNNIWFSYRESSFSPQYFSNHIYKLGTDRKTLTKYPQELWKQYSNLYCGCTSLDDPDLNFNTDIGRSGLTILKYHKANNSLLITPHGPLLEFFFDKVPTSVMEVPLSVVQLYPNPVQTGNTITIESSEFENVHNLLSVVIRDVSGATVQAEKVHVSGNKLHINSDGLINGSYFISVFENNKTILQTMFIKE